MLSNNHKRIILIFIDLLFSWFIWEINIDLGNPCYTVAFSRCFILSTTTFLIVYTPFEIYWSFRDLWFDRWRKLNLKELEISDITIEISDGDIHANLIKHRNNTKVNSKNTIIVICHGFSDTKETLQYYYYPLAYQGYIILAYDARGTGKSKKMGKRSQFLERVSDFKEIINWIKCQKEFSTLKINCIGFSVGAIAVLCGGFPNNDIKKIIVISSMSHYKNNIPKYNPIVVLSYLMKGVKLFPNFEENRKLSPYIAIEDVKKKIKLEKWEKYSKRVMLVHCRNDRIIKFKNFMQNKEILESPNQNLLILKKGGHTLKKNECALVGATLNFLNT